MRLSPNFCRSERAGSASVPVGSQWRRIAERRHWPTLNASWVCPKCKRNFGRINQRHKCGTGDRSKVLRGRPDFVVALYYSLESFAKTLGPVEFVTRERYVLLAVGEGSVFLTAPRVGQSPKWADRAVFRAPRSDEVTHSLSVRVEDVDSLYQRVKHGDAHLFCAPETHPFGERQFTVEDLGGHRWTFTQSVADVSPEDWGGVSGDEYAMTQPNNEPVQRMSAGARLSRFLTPWAAASAHLFR